MFETFLSARWENLIMANYVVDPALLKPYLPKGVELDFYHNKTYVSLVGFMFKQTSLFNIPIPFLGTFEEINLRFYVKRIDGDVIKEVLYLSTKRFLTKWWHGLRTNYTKNTISLFLPKIRSCSIQQTRALSMIGK